MSDDVNKDIQKAIQDAKGKSSDGGRLNMMPYDRYRLILKHDRIWGCDNLEEIERPITCEFLVDVQSPISPLKTEIARHLYAQLRDFLEKKENGDEYGMV